MRPPTSLRIALGLVLMLSATWSRAEGPDATRGPTADVAKQAQELLDAGVTAFKAGDLERARVALRQVITLVPDKPNPYRWLGLVETRLGHCKDALPAFEAFLGKVPAGDSRTVEVVTLRDRCRAELEPKVGTLIVASTPSGVEVRLREAGDPLLGRTPIDGAKLSAGSHVLVLRKDGYSETSRGVTITEHEVVRLDLVLEKLPPSAVKKKRYWIIGAVIGPLAAVGLGVGLGVGLTRPSTHTLPPLMGQ